MDNIYVNKDINIQALTDFLKSSKEANNEVYRVEVYGKGSVAAKFAMPPYSCDDKQQLYSLSKTFTSTAIGLLVDEGLLSEDDYMTDIFPDKMPEVISENLAAMQLKHLLSMNTGHDGCVMWQIKDSDDMVRDFFAKEVQHKPGTHFAYNSAASFILSCIVGKVTGMTAFDFLSERVFVPLGIEGVLWDTYSNGQSQGGIGMHASIDDITKLGVMYLNKGEYNGKRILSQKWVEKAASKISDNSGNGNPDWTAGYGYQIWRNARRGFRADGARGQVCAVFDDLGIVVAVHSVAADFQKLMDDIVDLAENLYATGSSNMEELESLIGGFYTAESQGELNSEHFGKVFSCQENKQGITRVMFEEDENKTVTVKFSNGSIWQSIKSGFGTFEKSVIYAKELKPMLVGLANANRTERMCIASYYTVEADKLSLHIRYTDTPQDDVLDFIIEDGKVRFVPCDSIFRVKE